MKVILLICALFFSLFQLNAQDIIEIIESKKQDLYTETDAEKKAIILGDLSWYYLSVSIDSAEFYGNKALDLSKKIKNEKLIAQSYSDLANINTYKGKYNKSIEFCNIVLDIRYTLKDEEGIASTYIKLGNNYNKLGDYDSTMFYYFKALKYYEQKGDSNVFINIESNISSAYYFMGNYSKALDYLESSLLYFKQKNDLTKLSNSTVNLGNIYLALKDTSNALSAFKLAKNYCIQSNNLVTLGTVYNNLSNIFTQQSKFDSAIYYVKKSIQIMKETGQETGFESANLTLALNEITMGDYKSAKPRLLNLKNSFEAISDKEKLRKVYLSLSFIYAFEQNKDSVNFYSNKYHEVSELLTEESMLRFSEELEVKYNTEKKEKELLLNRAKLVEKNLLIIGIAALFAISLLVFYLLYTKQKLLNNQLMKENELKDALLVIETQNKLQEQRLQISRDLHDNIGAQLTFIISSIDNLKFSISKDNPALDNKLSNISKFTRETIYELRDTIWAMNKDVISVLDLEERISNFIENAKISLQNIQFKFSSNLSDNEELKFSARNGMNIYRIIQEATNNAIKHSKASQINVSVQSDNNGIKISITDNGENNSEKFVAGNGIKSMQKRAHELNGNIQIVNLNGGTEVWLSLPK